MKVFIDGKEGTTGLRIFERLANRDDLDMIVLPEESRKDAMARTEAINQADLAILCLPDEAARESVSFLHNDHTRILDTSTAHRTLADWAYGFPELSPKRRGAIAAMQKVAVPGCHASGFISLAAPLIAHGLLSPQAALSCYSVTGYSGGGKKMIAAYENEERPTAYDSPRQYGLTQQHKHLKEMQLISGLDVVPIFAPIVADFYSGMVVTIPLFGSMVQSSSPKAALQRCLEEHYAGSKIVRVLSEEETAAENGFVASNTLSGKDSMELMVLGNDERLQVVSCFDNLGKGSSGAALQCMNIMMGLDETLGLAL